MKTDPWQGPCPSTNGGRHRGSRHPNEGTYLNGTIYYFCDGCGYQITAFLFCEDCSHHTTDISLELTPCSCPCHIDVVIKDIEGDLRVDKSNDFLSLPKERIRTLINIINDLRTSCQLPEWHDGPCETKRCTRCGNIATFKSGYEAKCANHEY